MENLIFFTVAKPIIANRPKIFLDIRLVDYFSIWFGLNHLPELPRPNCPMLIILGIDRLGSSY